MISWVYSCFLKKALKNAEFLFHFECGASVFFKKSAKDPLGIFLMLIAE